MPIFDNTNHPEKDIGKGDSPKDKLIRDVVFAGITLPELRAAKLLCDVLKEDEVKKYLVNREIMLGENMKIKVFSDEIHRSDRQIQIGMSIDGEWKFSCVEVDGRVPMDDKVVSVYLHYMANPEEFKATMEKEIRMRMFPDSLHNKIGVDLSSIIAPDYDGATITVGGGGGFRPIRLIRVNDSFVERIYNRTRSMLNGIGGFLFMGAEYIAIGALAAWVIVMINKRNK